MTISTISFGKWLAFLSFLFGTCFLVTFYYTGSDELLYPGYLFLTTVAIANLIVLIILLIKSANNSANRSEFLKTAGIMSLNIPVAVVYFYFVLVLLNTMRITFVNETGGTITNVLVDGCETFELGELQPNDKRTCWIDISRDCSITLEYSINGRTRSERIFDYVTTSMGQKGTFRIGTGAEPIDRTF